MTHLQYSNLLLWIVIRLLGSRFNQCIWKKNQPVSDCTSAAFSSTLVGDDPVDSVTAKRRVISFCIASQFLHQFLDKMLNCDFTDWQVLQEMHLLLSNQCALSHFPDILDITLRYFWTKENWIFDQIEELQKNNTKQYQKTLKFFFSVHFLLNPLWFPLQAVHLINTNTQLLWLI